MAEFIIDVDRIRALVTYSPTPTLDPSALGVIVVKQVTDYTDSPGTVAATKYTSTLGSPYITGPQLAASPAWLIFYSGNMGTDGNNTNARVSLLDNRITGTDRVWAFGGCKGSYSSSDAPILPKAARNTQCSGAFYYIPNGTDLEFGFENRSGNGACYFHDFEIIAVPTTTPLNPSDVLYAYVPPDHSDATGVKSIAPSGSGFVNMLSNPMISLSDNYLVIMSGASNNSNTSGGNNELQFVQDGVAQGFDWKKSTKFQGDLIPFNLMKVLTLASGQNVNLALYGLAGGGRVAYHPRILIMRLGAYARKDYTNTPSTYVPVTKVYPGSSPDTSLWQTVCGVSFRPISETGEYALVVARMQTYRTDYGAMLGRIIIQETGEVLKDFVCTDNISNLDYDRADTFAVAAKLVNTPYSYKLQVCQADGTIGTGFVGESTLAVIGMSPNAGASNIVPVTVTDPTPSLGSSVVTPTGTGTSTQGQGIVDASAPASSNVTVNVIRASTGTPALVRPRLWFYGNNRLTYLRTRTGAAQYTRWQAITGSAPITQTWQYVLKWKMTNNLGDLFVARDKYFGATGLFAQDIVMLLWGSDHSDSGFNYRFIMRDLSIALDWFYDDAGVDVMTVANGFPSNARTMIRNAILAMTYAKTQTRAAAVAMDPALGTVGSYLDWANTDTHNNHFYDMMMGATYAACSLYGESPATFTYKPGAASGWLSGTTRNFVIPYHIYSGNPSNHTDIWSWVQARVTNMMIPTLDTDIVGGFTEEGTNYGLSSAVYMTEMFSLLKSCAGQTHLDDHTCFKDHGSFQIYSAQPGVTNQVNLGDQPNNPVGRALINDRNRLLALMVADAFPSTSIAGFLQYWMNHKMTAMSEGTFEPWDFLLYRDTNPETDITGLPTHYVGTGTGFWNSRDVMTDIGTSVSMSAGSHGEEHHHSDFGALQIYRGDSPNPVDSGFLVIDINMKSTIGNNWDLVAHSTDTFATAGSPNGWPQQYFGTPPVVPPPPPTAPTAPVLSSPLDAATGVVVPVTLTWAASSGATSYNVQVGLNLSFTTVVYDVGGIAGTTTSVGGLTTGTVYYWRVSATNAGGTSGWSSTRSFTTSGTITPPTGGGVKLVEDTTALQIFPTSNWWNMDVSAWPVDAGSAGYISVLNAISSAQNPQGAFHPDWGTVGSTFGIPYIGVDGTQPLLPMTFSNYGAPAHGVGDESDYGQPGRPPGYPVPAQAITQYGYIEQGNPGNQSVSGDRHLLVFDRDNMLLYEIYKAFYDGSKWSSSNGACFQMNTNNRRPTGWTSTDAAGLAVFPGLIKYDDLHGSGPIKHATRFACKSANGYVYPGSHVGGASTTNHHVAGFLPFGGRIRLLASFNITTFVNGFGSLSASNKAAMTKLLQSWKTYGLIFADTGSNGFVQGTMDNRWVNGEFNQILHAVRFSNFEVLELGKIGP